LTFIEMSVERFTDISALTGINLVLLDLDLEEENRRICERMFISARVE